MSIIEIHGRGGYRAQIKSMPGGVQTDLSASIVYFEIPDADIRVLCTTDTTDAKSKVVTLTRAQVEAIPFALAMFAVIDETSLPQVIASGLIHVTGYKGAPA